MGRQFTARCARNRESAGSCRGFAQGEKTTAGKSRLNGTSSGTSGGSFANLGRDWRRRRRRQQGDHRSARGQGRLRLGAELAHRRKQGTTLELAELHLNAAQKGKLTGRELDKTPLVFARGDPVFGAARHQ